MQLLWGDSQGVEIRGFLLRGTARFIRPAGQAPAR
jgi:hypothetical protein